MEKLKQYLPIILAISLLVLADRLTKQWALTLQEPIHAGFFQFNLVFNTGASFGILQGNNLLFSVIAVVVLGAIIYYWKDIPRIPAILITSGLIGNLIDRLFFGRVIDFIDLGWWPVFNLADSLLVVGVVWLVVIEIARWLGRQKVR